MQTRRMLITLFVGAWLSIVIGGVLWFDNPTVDISASDINDSGPAGEVDCSIAPWDAALNDNDDGPGGEHLEAFHDEVAAACYAANTQRFNASVGFGVLAVVLLAGGVAVAFRSLWRTPTT